MAVEFPWEDPRKRQTADDLRKCFGTGYRTQQQWYADTELERRARSNAEALRQSQRTTEYYINEDLLRRMTDRFSYPDQNKVLLLLCPL